jgi:hypothetical protein
MLDPDPHITNADPKHCLAVCALAQDFPESNLITADHVGENQFFADRVANLGDFSPKSKFEDSFQKLFWTFLRPISGLLKC